MLNAVHARPQQTIAPAEPLRSNRIPQPLPAGRPAAVAPQGSIAGAARAPTEPSAAASPLRRLLVDVEHQREQLDRAIQQAASGRTFSPAELFALQARVYAYGENLEVLSHLLDRAVSAVKTTLGTQV